MSQLLVKPASSIRGEILLPCDKSISHRAVFLSALSEGKTSIENFSASKDCLYTRKAFQSLGVDIVSKGKKIIIYGKGLRGLKPVDSEIFVGDSGTTMRLLCGVLAGQSFDTVLKAGKSLSQRPMKRVLEPLRQMGANIASLNKKKDEEFPPLVIKGSPLKGIKYTLKIPSAQVKSAILLAALLADGTTQIKEPIKSRDHTERMLSLYGANIKYTKDKITFFPVQKLKPPSHMFIPGDISSASFFIIAAALLKNSFLKINSVGLNPTRLGLVRVLKRMGADIKIKYILPDKKNNEPYGEVWVKSSSLKATYVSEEEIPSLIDELPILMVACSLAKGKSVVASVQELRVKETDRINSMITGLSLMGAKIYVKKRQKKQDMVIEGVNSLKGACVSSFGDHRTAMSLAVAGLNAKGETIIDDVDCVDKSFPNFLELFKKVVIT